MTHYMGPVSKYLKMNFSRPKKSSVYIKILFEILKAGGGTINEILSALDFKQSTVSGRYRNWQYFKAMAENKLIKNIGPKNHHRYVLTEKGEDLLERVIA